MARIDLSRLYRSTVGFDHFASLLDSTLSTEQTSPEYPPYNIEAMDEYHYAITLAVASFTENELDIQVENGILTVRGKKRTAVDSRNYLDQGIASRSFERKFNLADHIEVTEATVTHGLLTVHLIKEIPEELKPRKIKIISGQEVIEDKKAAA
ncbi:MAG: Hsp20 family protein [Methylococcales bacterium]|nr:Hsp20 family protein [Methylococcales bacterium]MBT3699204.1 Hsp20 family protein [Methylococcales bacterium]MBT6250501.1 Hsp20 family protein [Nitrosomonadales bacterium]MBT7575590.1 Hsp20 family protein [Methylococcales bacterium]